MYWRVRKVGPQEMLVKYGPTAVLTVSLLLNVILILTRPDPKKIVPSDKKSEFDHFARTVTQHLLDTSYISYASSSSSLQEEMDPKIIEFLKQREMLPKSDEEFKAQARTLQNTRQLSAIHIDDVIEGDLDDNGFMPVEVKGLVAIRSADESGNEQPLPFDFRFKVGLNGKATPPKPIVAAFEDRSPPPPK